MKCSKPFPHTAGRGVRAVSAECPPGRGKGHHCIPRTHDVSLSETLFFTPCATLSYAHLSCTPFFTVCVPHDHHSMEKDPRPHISLCTHTPRTRPGLWLAFHKYLLQSRSDKLTVWIQERVPFTEAEVFIYSGMHPRVSRGDSKQI